MTALIRAAVYQRKIEKFCGSVWGGKLDEEKIS